LLPVFIVSLMISAGADSVAPADTFLSPNKKGTISGKISYPGKAPKPQKVMVVKDVKVCAKVDHFDERLVVDEENGIKDVVVWLEKVEGGKSIDSLGQEFILDQKVCAYKPHVLIVPVNTPVKILNNDKILHNIHTYCAKNKPVNLAQPRFKKTIRMTFKQPEKVQVRCDVHGWMSAWIVVVEHAYYTVTDEKGEYSLDGIPPGGYTLKFWQESLGERDSEVTIEEGTDIELNYVFELTKPAAQARE